MTLLKLRADVECFPVLKFITTRAFFCVAFELCPPEGWMLEAFSTFLCEICAKFLLWELSCRLPSAWVLLGSGLEVQPLAGTSVTF